MSEFDELNEERYSLTPKGVIYASLLDTLKYDSTEELAELIYQNLRKHSLQRLQSQERLGHVPVVILTEEGGLFEGVIVEAEG